jgi:ADP-ribosyl-[dinitrogen reductase] hydrolase
MAAEHSKNKLTDKAIASFWGLAVGDALGATVEFMTPREIRHRYGVHDSMRGGGWLGLKKGQVTDDTEMAMALGRSILQQGRLDARSVAQHFDKWLRGKPVDVGQTVRRGIVHFRRTGMTEVAESNDAGNGACMRLLPVALLTLGHSQADIQSASCQQAHITHHNVLSDAACETVTHILHGALYGADKIGLLHGPIADLITQHPQFNFRKRRMENPSGYIVDTIHAVLQSFIDTDNFRDCLIDVVNRGGDADTTGAIAGMIAGAYYGLPDIPTEWLSIIDSQVRASCRNQAKSILNLSVSDTNLQQARKMEAGI